MKRFFHLNNALLILALLMVPSVLSAVPQLNVSQTAPKFAQYKAVPKSSQSTGAKAPEYVEGEVIVSYKANVTAAKAASMAATQGMKVAKQYKAISAKTGRIFAKVSSSKSTADLVTMLKADPNVESVSPNYIRRIKAMPNDPDFNQVWGLNNTGQSVNGTYGTNDADTDTVEAWNTTTGSSNVVVAVFDTGVDYTHEDLAANMWVNPAETAGDGIDNDGNGYIDDIYGADVASDLYGLYTDGDPMDIYGHGTHVAGTIGAVGDNGIGITGVNWNIKIMAMKVFRPDLGAYDDDILDAINYVLDQKSNGVNIVAVNASYGGEGGNPGDVMDIAIQSLGDAGIVFCAAAGNESKDNDNHPLPSFPSSYSASNIIAVAATDQNDQLASFSNYGATTVDLAAPGTNIRSTLPGGGLIASPLIEDTFEASAITWSVGGTSNWTLTTEDSYSPSSSMTDSQGSLYANNTDSYIMSDPIDLSGQTGSLSLGFRAKLDIEEGWDYLYVLISDDNGTNWTLFMELTGENQPWDWYSMYIPKEFYTANFKITFEFISDSTINYDGVHIDDVAIGTAAISNKYANWDGTSMATPSVAGAVALLAAANPNETAAQRIYRLLSTVDYKADFYGKVLTSGRMNIASAIDPNLVVSNPPPALVPPTDPNPTTPPSTSSSSGGIPVYDLPSMLVVIFGFLMIGGLIARRKLA